MKMEWVEGESLHSYISRNLYKPDKLIDLLIDFISVSARLKDAGIAHCDLQHGNILVRNDKIILIDYDGMYVPGLRGLDSHEVGHRNFQHPMRSPADFNVQLDNFSEWIIGSALIALSNNPGLWDRFGQNEDAILFVKEDFTHPDNSRLLDELCDPGCLPAEVAGQLKSMMKGTLSAVPDFYREIKLAGVQTSPIAVTAGGGSSNVGLPNWVPTPGAHADKDAESMPRPDASWVFSHLPLQPIPPLRPSKSLRLLARGSLLFGLTALLVLAPGLGSLLTFALLGTWLVALSGAMVALGLGYRQHPARKAASRVRLDASGARRDRDYGREGIKRSEQRRASSGVERSRDIGKFAEKRNVAVADQSRKLQEVDAALSLALIPIRRRLVELASAEQRELADALKRVRSSALIHYLETQSVTRAAIPGISRPLTWTLDRAGVRTAADIEGIGNTFVWWGNHRKSVMMINIRGRGPIHVEGIGPVKAASLWSWRNQLASLYATKLPGLPPAEETTIKAKYQAFRIASDRGEDQHREAARRASDELRAGYARILSQFKAADDSANAAFDREDRDVRLEISQRQAQQQALEGEAARLERDSARYRRISFARYIRAAVV